MAGELNIQQGSKEWKKLRKRAQTDLYWLNAKVLGHEKLGQFRMTYKAHYALCRFAERRTGIPAIDNSRVQLIQVGRGWGKATALDTPIPTPYGWTTMGEIEVGDELFSSDGSITKVAWKSPIQFGNKCYRITFDDNESLVVDGEHLWVVLSNRYTRHLRSTDELRYDLTRGSRGDRKWRVENAGWLDIPLKTVPVDPYCLGVWLGDGSKSSGQITTADQEIVKSFEQAGYEVTDQAAKYHYYVRGLQKQLRALNVLNNKHVPLEYLRGSSFVRQAILQGLMDSDGTASKDCNEATFANTNKRLAEAVYELVVSLGMKARWSERPAKLNGETYGTCYEVTFRPLCRVFHLDRKANRICGDVGQSSRHTVRMIKSIDSVDSVAVQCLKVEHPSSMFLVGKGMIPNPQFSSRNQRTNHPKAHHQIKIGPQGS